MDAGTRDQLESGWSVSNDNSLMYSTTSEPAPLVTTDASSQYVTSHGILQAFATVQLQDGAFQLATGAFPPVYMTSMAGNFERISPDVIYQAASCPQASDLSQGQSIGDSKQYISVPFLMSGLSQSQSQPSNSVSFSIPSSSLGLGYSGLLQGMGVGVSPSTGLPLGLSMSEGTSNETITTQELNSGATLPATSTTNNGSMLQMLSSIYPQTSLSVPLLPQSSMIGQPAQESSGNSAILEMVLPSQAVELQRNGAKYADDSEVAERQDAFDHLRMSDNCGMGPCSSDEGDLDQLLGEDDYSNVENPDQMMESKEENVVLRKSERLAQRESSPSPAQKVVYVSKPYNTYELWCEDCQTSYMGECLKHKLVPVCDKVVQSRAWSSLPPILQIFRLGEANADGLAELGVFAKRLIPRRTQFGPFLANLVGSVESLPSKAFLLVVERDNSVSYLDAVDENCCNWMMFVRPAANYAEQNMVAYQFGNDIYFSTTRNVEPRQELKVWYAAHYAERLGLSTHQPSPCDQKVIEESELNWPCYECTEKFRSSALLQKHLAEHDEPVYNAAAETETTENAAKRPQGRPRKRGYRTSRRHGCTSTKNSLKTDDENSADETGSSSFQSWKKRKTRLYLNRMKKYKEPIKRSIRVLHRRLAWGLTPNGADDLACTHCDLIFESQVMLNLHTLTHAAEDAGFGDSSINAQITMQDKDGQQLVNLDTGPIECPICKLIFGEKTELFSHASQHATVRRRQLINPTKPYKCNHCWKAFTVQERLQRHMLCHADENTKPLQCQFCKKRFMNNSALACHLKTHSDKKYYECPLCHEGFDQIHVLRTHAEKHRIAGVFECPECHRMFDGYHGIRNHMRSFHSAKIHQCVDCGKLFPRSDKLKLHRLRHSAHREFMCEACGRQFKRKDKLHEHTKRMHDPAREVNATQRESRVPSANKFVPKVSPSDYQRFIYKCHECLLGFKRRGMLVNHLAKRHPDQRMESVPELNLPILRSQRDYYCQYCDKVYKSSSKRKAHILKNHPGADLPASARKKDFSDFPGLPNPTFSAPVGNVTTVPHPCGFCHKQYASKAKLLQHQRKKHHDKVISEAHHKTINSVGLEGHVEISDSKVLSAALISRCIGDSSEIQILQPSTAIELGEADLLTQAMSELQQSYGEYRVTGQAGAEFQTMVPCIINTSSGTATAALVQTMAGSTVELSQLGQHFAQLHAVQSTASGNQVIQAVPVSIASTYLQRAWNNANGFQTF